MPRTLLGRRPPRRVAKAANAWDDAVDEFGAALSEALRRLAESAMAANARSALARGDVSAFLGLLDWDTLTYDLADLQANLGGAALAEGLADMARIGDGEIYLLLDLMEPRAINYARQRAAAFITEISDGVREVVQTFVGDALEYGRTINVLAAQIRDVIPLSTRFAQAVENHYERVVREAMADGKTFDQANRMAGESSARYAERLRATRARAIARTEVMSASQAGRFEGWAAMIGSGQVSTDMRKEWITGGDPCPDCDPMDGEVVAWDGEFSAGVQMPPLHVGCRCVGVLRAPDTPLSEGFRKARRRDQEPARLIITYAQGAAIIASALAVGRTTTEAEHEAFVRETLEG